MIDDALLFDRLTACPTQTLRNDDGQFNNVYGISGTALGSFIKRFTPACHPFQLEQIEFLVGDSPSIVVGRPIRLLVYTDPTGSGDPSLATLVYTEDTTIQVTSYSTFNQYVLATPVAVGQGDVYIGYQDLVPDPEQTTMALRDTSVEGDSWRASSLAPEQSLALTGGTWMIRGHGGAVPTDSVELHRGEPCNLAEVPGQDFAVCAGTIGNFSTLESLACATGGHATYVDIDPAANRFYLVVPQSHTREGSYGKTGAGDERPPAALPCKFQEIDPCP